MVRPIELIKTEVDNKPYLVWNAFIELISGSKNEELNTIQSVASFSFWYDSEVQNGGHLQFFENRGKLFINREKVLIDNTMGALKVLGAKKQADILSAAAKKYLSQIRKHPAIAEEYSELALADEFGEFDSSYYECAPDMNSLLEKYLKAYLNEFVKLV